MKLSRIVCGAAAIALAIATSGAANASDAPGTDIATKIMSNPYYASAAKGYALRRGYQAKRPVINSSNFLPIFGVVAAVTTATVVATKGSAASPS